jgi:cytosine permease
LLIAAGAFGAGGKYGLNTADPGFMSTVMGSQGAGKTMGLLLALAAFPPACFSSFIAANSFKTTLPKVNPFVSVGIGTAVSVLLAVTGWAGDAGRVFTVIGASFGPICGAMMVDYLLSGKKWAGPRAGFNLAGWISWAAGFIVGIAPLVKLANVPAAPLMAFIVGAVLYYVLAKAGLQPPVVPMTSGEKAQRS